MEQRRFDQFTQIFLVNASQMAYLEEAHETQAMLQKFIELFRYFNKADALVNLKEEMLALRNYVDLQKLRYGSRLEITCACPDERGDTPVRHLAILDFFDNLLGNALVQFENAISCNIGIEPGENARLKVVLEADGQKEEFSRVLLEEVNSGV